MSYLSPILRVIHIAVVFSIITASFAARADKKAEAIKHFEAGLALLETEDYKSAAFEFEISANLYPTRMNLFNLANCQKALQKYGDALNTLLRLQKRFGNKLDAYLKKEVNTLKQQLEKMAGSFVALVDVAKAKIIIDDEEIAQSPMTKAVMLSPGKYTVKVNKDGYKEIKRIVYIFSMSKIKETFKLEKTAVSNKTSPKPENFDTPAKTENHKKAWGVTFLTGGILSGGLSIAFYSLASKSNNNFNDASSDYSTVTPGTPHEDKLWNDMQTSLDELSLRKTLGLTFAITAGAMITTGTILLMLSGNEKPDNQKVKITAAPGGLKIRF